MQGPGPRQGTMLITNVKVCKFVDRRTAVTIDVLNPARHSFTQSCQEFIQLMLLAFDHKLDAPIG